MLWIESTLLVQTTELRHGLIAMTSDRIVVTGRTTGLVERRTQTVFDHDRAFKLNATLIEPGLLLSIQIQKAPAASRLRLNRARGTTCHDHGADDQKRNEQPDLHPPVMVQSA